MALGSYFVFSFLPIHRPNITMTSKQRKKLKFKQILCLLGFSCTVVSASFEVGPSFEVIGSSEDSQLSEIRTNFVLLADSGGWKKRFRRDLDTDSSDTQSDDDDHSASNSDSPTVVENDEKNKIYTSGSENGSARGHLVEDFDVSKVDIKDEQKQLQSSHPEYNYDNTTDNAKYYMHQFHQKDGANYSYDLDIINKTGKHAGLVMEHSMLSQSYRRAATISLSFKFPFYGHQVENITIATGGFLYTGDYVHSWLAATQYIAPLMANFDTSSNHEAKIRYLDDGTKLVVEWKDVYLQERVVEGPFTFQVILHKNGDIWFAYRTIPLEIISIKDEDHPVKVGLSDAYIIDRTIYFARRKTIYEYHRLNMKSHQIQNKTAIVFQALKTCNTHMDCSSCMMATKVTDDTSLGCRWCPKLGRCSDGTDRNRQDWLKKHCDSHNISTVEMCPQPGQSYPVFPGLSAEGETSFIPDNQSARMNEQPDHLYQGPATSAGTVVISMLVPLLLISSLVWVAYAYFNPNTCSGRFLIKYRPGAWRWRQSGGRYTAASIHM